MPYTHCLQLRRHLLQDAAQRERPAHAAGGDTLNRARQAQIVADKIKYQATWPRRTYTLLPETLSIAPSNDANGPIHVAFEYRFEVSNPTRRIQGRGRTNLTLLGRNGRYVITQERGEVTERH